MKPLSRPHELGRAVGYNLDPVLLLEELKQTPSEHWHRAMLDYVSNATRSNQRSGAKAKRMWLVVKLENNVPVMIDAYTDKRSANNREKFLRQHMRAERDEIRILKLEIGS